jgi:hypothetical protein
MRDQNSIARLLAGTAQTLETQVLPAVEDAFTRRQLGAAIELLRHVAPRADWVGAAPACDTVVAAARSVGWAGEPDAGAASRWLAGQDPDAPGVRAAQQAARTALLEAAETDRADRDHTMLR